MFYTKNWGMVSSKAELYMLARAEREFEKKRKEGKRHGRDDLYLYRRRYR